MTPFFNYYDVTFNGDLYAKLHPEIVTTVVSKPNEEIKSASSFNAYGKLRWDGEKSGFQMSGQCSLYQSADPSLKPLGMPVANQSNAVCLGREIYIENNHEQFKFLLGKKPLDFSQALLTSPSNPSIVGLTLPSPMLPQEGIWSIQGKYVQNSESAYTLGVAYNTYSNAFPISPFVRWKVDKGKFDYSTVIANMFMGAAVTFQFDESWLFYSEGNTHFRAYDQPMLTQLAYDGLMGASYSPKSSFFTITAEYFRNSNGVSGGASPERLRIGAAQRGASRNAVYGFATPVSQQNAHWGLSEFLSQNLMLVHFRMSEDRSGPLFTSILSLDDHSLLTSVGYRFIRKDWATSIDWRSYRGPPYSEYFEASKVMGQNIIILTFTAFK
jgi:hypothetical protein